MLGSRSRNHKPGIGLCYVERGWWQLAESERDESQVEEMSNSYIFHRVAFPNWEESHDGGARPFWGLTGTGACRLLCGMADAARALLLDIEVYCRRCGIAESTFGRRAVNDGKFVARLRGGKGITTTTLERVRSFMGARPATSESTELSSERDLKFNAYSDKRAIFRYEMHTLPSEIGDGIGTSTLFAAWNAAIYVAQIEEERLEKALASSAYLEATREVLQKHGGLWFLDESYVVSRRRL